MTGQTVHEELASYGLRWFVRSGDATAHLCGPSSDASSCGRILTRSERRPVSRSDYDARLCDRCAAAAGLDDPNPRSASPLELASRRERFVGE